MSRPAVPSPGRDPERTLPFSAPVVPPAAHLPPEYAGETAPGAPGAAPRVTVVEPPKESFDKEPGVHPEPSSGTTTPETQNYADMQDYFDWTTETDVTESARDDSADAVRKLSLRNMSPAKLVLILCTTFLGNLVLTGIMLVPILVIHYVYRKRDDDHKVYIADNVEAWFIWAAFNLHLQWWIHFLVELMPAIITGVLRLVWGAPGQRLQNYLEYYRALNRYLKLLFYAALNWGSWTIIFNSIFGLYSASNPSETSRAPYTYRIYQVMEFIVRRPTHPVLHHRHDVCRKGDCQIYCDPLPQVVVRGPYPEHDARRQGARPPVQPPPQGRRIVRRTECARLCPGRKDVPARAHAP